VQYRIGLRADRHYPAGHRSGRSLRPSITFRDTVTGAGAGVGDGRFGGRRRGVKEFGRGPSVLSRTLRRVGLWYYLGL
jgi:hypothetical protein